MSNQDFDVGVRLQARLLKMYKALLAPDDRINDENPTTNSDLTLDIIATLLNLCSTHGIALTRWLTIHNSMLEKSIGNDLIDKLRVIHIFEADFNLLLGILWSKRLMDNAQRHNSLSVYQWGGMKGKQCIEPVIMKVLSYELSALTRTSLIAIDKDAASCYNRIVMSISNLRDQQLGMPIAPCKMLASILEFTK